VELDCRVDTGFVWGRSPWGAVGSREDVVIERGRLRWMLESGGGGWTESATAAGRARLSTCCKIHCNEGGRKKETVGAGQLKKYGGVVVGRFCRTFL